VIAVDSPGIRESVVDGKTGFLVTSSPGAIAQRMRELIAQPGLVETLGRQGRKFAEGFTWERAADDTEADLEAIIRGSGR
jgi:glycosyltransferase involved in cell wall biosynthesis